MSVECEPIICPLPEPIVCTEEGEVVKNSTGDCCTQQLCGEWCRSSLWDALSLNVLCRTIFIIRPCLPECDKTRCPMPPECSLGFELTRNTSNARCCPSYRCGKFWHTHLCKPAAFLRKSEMNLYSILFCHIVPKSVCVFNNTEYTVGKSVYIEFTLLGYIIVCDIAAETLPLIAPFYCCSLVWSSPNTHANNVSALILRIPAPSWMP